MNKKELITKLKAMFEEVGDKVALENGEYPQPNGDIWVVEDGVIVEIKKAEEAPAEEEAPKEEEQPVEAEEETPAVEETPAPAVEEAPAETEEAVATLEERVASIEETLAELLQKINLLAEQNRQLTEQGEDFKATFQAMEHKPSAQPVSFNAEAPAEDSVKAKLANLKKLYK